MRSWYRRLSILMVCFLLVGAAFALPVHAEDCDHEYVQKEVEATCTTAGVIYMECSKCGHTTGHANTEALGHNYGEWVVTEEASCGIEGEEIRTCTRCDNSETRVIPALEHNYVTTTVAPTCTEQGYDEAMCMNCGHSIRSNYTAALGHTEKSEIVPPTCDEEGYTLHTCTVCRETRKTDYVDALGHTYGAPETVAPTCTEQGYDLHTCTVCQGTMKDNFVDALGHEWESEIVPPTCDEEGYTLNICVVCREREKTDYVDALGHKWESEIIDPTCDKQGYTLHICSVCQEAEKTDFVDALGHKWESNVVAPTCTDRGFTENTCVVCEAKEKVDYVDALGHDWEGQTIAPTCTERGYTLNTCKVCHKQEKVDYVDALGHDLESQVVEPTCTAKGYTLETCKRCDYKEKTNQTEKIPHTYDEGVVTKEATDTAMGRITYTCTVCGDTKTETTPKLVNPFKDVSKSAYYYKPVLWAVDRKITSGTDETHFSPNASCTRAQVVTFLWRAAGSPEPKTTECPFKDVPANSYYLKAVLWALENEVTSGISSTQFGPNNPCTRAQVVTFLYRAAGSPEWKATDRFKDVDKGSYYYTSVSWAADMGITSGVDGEHFGPNQVCTRAQVVTFLYRNAYAEAPEVKPEETPETKPEETPEESKPVETPEETKPEETKPQA